MAMQRQEPTIEALPITSELMLPDVQKTEGQLRAIRAFQEACQRHLIDGMDFGVIPGTGKPTLLKPGAEKIVRLLGLADEYVVQSEKNWDKPLFAFQVTCLLRHLGSGQLVATGVGECNSMEARYRWRQANRRCPECDAEAIIKGKVEYGGGWLCFGKRGGCGAKFADGSSVIEGQQTGRVENDDIFSQVNTILKMAKKRAMVDAALSVGRLSNIFTQDIEDMAPANDPSIDEPPQANTPQQRRPSNGGRRGQSAQQQGESHSYNADGEREFAHVGAFLTAAMQDLGMPRDRVLAVLGVEAPAGIGNLTAAWVVLREGGAGAPKQDEQTNADSSEKRDEGEQEPETQYTEKGLPHRPVGE